MEDDQYINIHKPCNEPATIDEAGLRYLVIPIAPVVLFPGHVLTINDMDYLSEDDWRKARSGTLRFALVPTLAEDGEEALEHLSGVGTEAVVSDVINLPDGRNGIVVRGTRRLILRQLYRSGRRMMTKADVASDMPHRRTTKFVASVAALRNSIAEVVKLNATFNREIATILAATDEPDALANLIAPHLSISFAQRVELLATFSITTRVQMLIKWLGRESQLLSMANKIKDDVQLTLKDHQKRAFLHEQVKSIKRELGDIGDGASEIEELVDEINELELPDDVRTNVDRELDRMLMMPPGSPEYMVSYTYVTWIRDLPWGESEIPPMPSLEKARAQLDKDHFGLAKVKERILEYLAVMHHRGPSKGEVLLLSGPPGVGKTSLGKSVAAALNRPFVRVSLGGVRDESEIRGHRRTYIGSMPGKIISAIKQAKMSAPVILLDEIEKVGLDHGRGDVSNALLEVLDQEQNSTFVDHFLSVPYDLSKVVFIATANTIDTIPPPLMDRMEHIQLSSYTELEKLAIAKKHLVQKVRKDLDLRASEFSINDTTMKQLIRGYTREAGVRQLRREIQSLARKSIKERLSKKVFKVNPTNLSDYIGQPKFLEDQKEAKLIPGIAIGLAWTSVGGDVLFIEANKYRADDLKGDFKLTGHLGKVMQESASAAMTWLKGYANVHPERLRFSGRDLASHTVHMHFPDGATPKDGPSAGVAILASLASLFSNQALPANLAMTGEITLRGRVLPVGGIREKVLAAHRFGKRKILIPEQNRHDLDDVPSEVTRALNIVFISRMEEVLQHCGIGRLPKKGIPLREAKRAGASSRPDLGTHA